jgi:WD repeat-containing protein 23
MVAHVPSSLTISGGLLHRHQRRALRTHIRVGTRARGQPSTFPDYVSKATLTARLGIPGGRLVLRHRRPLTQPYPNAYSHPLPRFRYNGRTGRISVEFQHDPAFAGGTAWHAQTFHLTALPRRRPRTLLDGATDTLASAFRAPLSFLGVPSSPATAHDMAAGTDDAFSLRQDEVAEQDRGEDAEVDDDPARVRVIGLTPEEHHELGDKAWARQQWEVLPLRTTAARRTSQLV